MSGLQDLPAELLFSVPLSNVFTDAQGNVVHRGFVPTGYHYSASRGDQDVYVRDTPLRTAPVTDAATLEQQIQVLAERIAVKTGAAVADVLILADYLVRTDDALPREQRINPTTALIHRALVAKAKFLGVPVDSGESG